MSASAGDALRPAWAGRRSSIPRRWRGAPTVCKLVVKPTQTQQTKEQSANPLVLLIVGAATETLRVAGVGSSTPGPTVPPGPTKPLWKGDVWGVMRAIRADFDKRNYFITGVLTDAIYDEDCYFADPTIKFKGRELWKRNLALLVPFLEDPDIRLLKLERLAEASPKGSSRGKGAVLRAEWVLTTGLRLPWRPYVVVNGSTEYTLVWPDNNRVEQHVEAWDISGLEALALVFTPGGKKRLQQRK